ncbi:MAG: hypothetical protein ACLT76_10020 [Clostridium fessum]
MINKRLFLAGLTTGLLSLSAAFPAMAGSWKNGAGDNAARWWYDNGDNTWAANGWRWIDGNQDGVSECYYFDAEGWLLTSTTTPDGYNVNADGAWTVNGIAQIRQTAASSESDNESWDDFQNGSSKKAKKQPPAPAGRQIPEALTPAPAHPKILPAMISSNSNGSSGSHSNSGSSGPSKETSSTSGDKKPDAPKKNSKQEPGSGYRQGSVTDEQIANNSSSDSTKE